MTTLEVQDLHVRFGSGHSAVEALAGVSLTVESNRILGLVGESGSGKSTLAKAIVGLAPITSGRILLDGQQLRPARGRRAAGRQRAVQLVFQDPNSSLDPRMSIGGSLAEGLAAAGVTRRATVRSEVGRLLEQVQLDPRHAKDFPRNLSGGQRQRVALARALAARPTVLVADEVTSALDASVQGSVLNLVRDIQRELGLTVLFISHNLAVVRYLADSVAVMYCGRIVESAETIELTQHARHPYTRALLGSVPRLRRELVGAGSAGAPPRPLMAGDGSPVIDADPADPHRPPAGCRFHPRCGQGPLRHAERTVCVTTDPSTDAASRPHQVACFFGDRLE